MLFIWPSSDNGKTMVKHFSLVSIKSKLENKNKVEIYILSMANGKYLKYESNMRCLSKYPPMFPYLKYFQGIDPLLLTITKSLSNKIGEIFCKGLKWICKLFEIGGEKYFKTRHFFEILLKYFIIDVAQNCLASFAESRITCFFICVFTEIRFR